MNQSEHDIPFKQPLVSSGGECYGIPQSFGGGVGTQRVTENALAYLKEVKNTFHDQGDKYDMFIGIMKDFRRERIATTLVISRVNELFKGHPDLIRGFNSFIPKGCDSCETAEFQEAATFVNKVMKRFEKDVQVYRSFLHILNMYREEHKTIKEVYSEIAALFTDHQDLLAEFTRFLPQSIALSSERTAEPEEAVNKLILGKL